MKYFPTALAGLILAANALITAPAQATEPFEYEGDYIEHRQAWPEAWSNEVVVEHAVTGAISGLKSLLMDLNEQNAFPEQLTTYEDIQQLDLYEDKVLASIKEMNEWAEKQRERKGGSVSWTDGLPDALVVFAGGKKSFTRRILGVSSGGSGMLGIVLMPQKITRIDVRTGKVIQRETVTGEMVDWSFGFSMSVIGWVNGDIGYEASTSKSPKKRFGMGFIWDVKDQMVEADDFAGAGPTGSVNYDLGRLGKNMKLGALNLVTKKDGFQAPDFVYSTTSWPLNVTRKDLRDAGVAGHLNASVILPWESIARVIGGVISDQIEDINEEIEKGIEKAVKEYFNTQQQKMDAQNIEGIEKEDSKEEESDIE